MCQVSVLRAYCNKNEARILSPTKLTYMYLKQKLFCQTLSPRGKKTIQKENKLNSMFDMKARYVLLENR